eukprot:5999749-Lingulodinium_polyedra.AAC.1
MWANARRVLWRCARLASAAPAPLARRLLRAEVLRQRPRAALRAASGRSTSAGPGCLGTTRLCALALCGPDG